MALDGDGDAVIYVLALLVLVVLLAFLALVWPPAWLVWRGPAPWFVAQARGLYRSWVAPFWFVRIAKAVGFGKTRAVTLGHLIVFLAIREDGMPEPIDERHEMEHVFQTVALEPAWWPRWLGRRAIGVLRFWAAYIPESIRNGYWNNRFERAARVASGQGDAKPQ